MKTKYIIIFLVVIAIVEVSILGVLQAPNISQDTSSSSIVKSVPTPSAPQDKQPNCLAGAFAILSAEVMNTNISASRWESRLIITNNLALLTNGLAIWNAQYPSNHMELMYAINDTNSPPVSLHKPLLWIGLTQGGDHAAVVYLAETNVMIKHFIYDPATHTNYCETLGYDTFFTRTFFVYKIKA